MAVEGLASSAIPFYLSEKFFVAFAFVFFVVSILKPTFRFVTAKLDDRAKEIEDNLQKSALLKEKAQEVLASYEKRYADFEKEAQIIIADAEKEARRIIDGMEVEVGKELEKKMRLADERVRQYQLKMVNDINIALSDLAIKKAEEILGQELKDENKKASILNASIAQIKKKLH